MSEAAFPVASARARRPRAGYAMAVSAATLWGLNGAVSKVVLAHGFSSGQLALARSAGACAGLALGLALLAPRALRVRAAELPRLALFGVCGLAFVQWFYFLSIHRLDIGVALLIQYLAPLLVALFARFVLRERVRRRIWAALALALAGLALIVDVAHGVTLDGVGVAAALAGAVAYAFYVLLAERTGERGPVSLLCFGFGFAALFWALVSPVWRFPGGRVPDAVSLLGRLDDVHCPVWALLAWVVVPGTIVPFVLLLRALRHLPATRVAIAAMAEPVVATLVAWAWLGERLGPVQLAGAAVVLVAILLAQTAR
ncbi:MAG TPA: DMT family transporter [Gaiellaceae bacterium]|nr:DMT family transporter [Gaiellaceae bacterium]